MLVILTPQAMTDPTRTAEMLAPFAHIHRQAGPRHPGWAATDVERGANLLREAGIPTFPYPDTAAHMFNYLWRYDESLRALYETPALPDDAEAKLNRTLACDIVEKARTEGRSLLTEFESKQVLVVLRDPDHRDPDRRDRGRGGRRGRRDRLPGRGQAPLQHDHPQDRRRRRAAQPGRRRRRPRGLPLDPDSRCSSKKGPGHFDGVTVQPMINYSGYELIIGSSIDPQFGPVLLFGMGGQLVELFRDRALALPPLTTTLARRMIEQTKIYGALKGIRGRAPIDQAALEQLLVRFGQLVAEQPWIKEIDINPLLASPERLIALDARVVLHDPGTPESALPRLAIRPYPLQYAGTWNGRRRRRVRHPADPARRTSR